MVAMAGGSHLLGIGNTNWSIVERIFGPAYWVFLIDGSTLAKVIAFGSISVTALCFWIYFRASNWLAIAALIVGCVVWIGSGWMAICAMNSA